jgi:ribosomal protein S18 acetylase RimI-like enzyme
MTVDVSSNVSSRENASATITARRAVTADADAITDAHVWGWRAGYRGLFPDDYLDSDEFDRSRRANWHAWTWRAYGSERSELFVVEVDEHVVGFGHAGPERVELAVEADDQTDDESDGTPDGVTATPIGWSETRGEVFGFYVHPHAWGSGAATVLMHACTAYLRADGFAEAVLWVLRDNPRARGFYEKAGWRPSGESGEWAGPVSVDGPVGPPVAEVQYIVAL